MKTLTTYTKNKYEYTIILREGDLAISFGKSRISDATTWEVFQVQSHNGLTIGGVYMPPAEFCPSNEQWGTKGWTALNKDRAFEILNREKNLSFPKKNNLYKIPT